VEGGTGVGDGARVNVADGEAFMTADGTFCPLHAKRNVVIKIDMAEMVDFRLLIEHILSFSLLWKGAG
jgi:hypothetical protein